MSNKLNKYIDKDKVHTPKKFDERFEETLNNLPDKSTYKKNPYKFIASIACITILTTGMTMAISNKPYKYMPTSGAMFTSEKTIYGLENTIVKKDAKGKEIELDMFINTENNRAVIQTNGELNIPESEKAELKIGDDIYINKRTSLNQYKYTWGATDIFEDIKDYNENDEIIYTLYTDENNKLDFNIKLKEIDGVEDYSDLGFKAKDKNISLNAIVNEYDGYIEVDFFNPLDDYSNIIAGIDSIDEVSTGIYLTDANDKSVFARREISSGGVRYNRVKIDTTNLEKPYKLIVPQLKVDLYKENKIAAISEEINIEVPKNGETIEINKDIEMNFAKNIIDTTNNKVKLTKGTREDNKFILEVEYTENEDNIDKISNVMAYQDKLIGKYDEVWSSSYFDDEDKLVTVLEFTLNPMQKNIKFKLSPDVYEIKGNWTFTIE